MISAVIKSSFIRNGLDALGRARAHVRYIAHRPGAQGQVEPRQFFSDEKDSLSANQILNELEQFRGNGVLVHKMILSPVLNEVNLQTYTREVFSKYGKQKGLDLRWRAVIHDNTSHNHAHVIIFGKDKNGRNVRINRDDLKVLREIGERYLQREHALDLKLANESREKPKKLLARVASLIEASKHGARRYKELNEIKEKQDQRLSKKFLSQRQAEKQELAALENKAFGAQPDKYVQAFQKIAKWQRHCLKQERQQKESQIPINIDHANAQSISYTQNTSREELVFLKSQYEAGKLSSQITPREFKRLSRWIANWERWERETARLDAIAKREARYIKSIQIYLNTVKKESFTPDCELEKLKQLQKMHDKAEVHINPAEYKALTDWIKLKERCAPIVLDMGNKAEPLVYSMDDPKESLELFAKVGRDALAPQDYKKLWWWIFEKQRIESSRAPSEKTSEKSEKSKIIKRKDQSITRPRNKKDSPER